MVNFYIIIILKKLENALKNKTMQIEIKNNDVAIEYTISHDQVKVIVKCGDDNSVNIEGPLDLMLKSIGGRGLENNETSILTEKELPSVSIAISSILEILNQVLKNKKKATYISNGPKE